MPKYKLAINGGPKVRYKKFPFCTPIGREEIKAATEVLKSGILSQFLGSWHESFYGGPQVQQLEKEWAAFYKVKHAVSVNSATSALICAVGAAGISPGDEVIVTPYSMCVSATAPLFYGAIPVFADIEEDYLCLNPKSIEQKITKRTRAIIVADILGQPYDAAAINKLARKYKLIVIEDAAQAPGAKYKGKYAGTLADMGIYSLNYHKHIHTGEGGILVTDDDILAERARMIRNHADAVIDSRPLKLLKKKSIGSYVNMLGYNFRMTELEAAVARQQLKKIKKFNTERLKNVNYLAKKLSVIPFIKSLKKRPGCEHVYYMPAFSFDEIIAGVARDKFIKAVAAELSPMAKRENEGVLIETGYVKPLYLLPIFQKQICYGSKGYPFRSPYYKGKLSYQKGLAPVCEYHHYHDLFLIELIMPGLSRRDLDDIAEAFYKVWRNLGEL